MIYKYRKWFFGNIDSLFSSRTNSIWTLSEKYYYIVNLAFDLNQILSDLTSQKSISICSDTQNNKKHFWTKKKNTFLSFKHFQHRIFTSAFPLCGTKYQKKIIFCEKNKATCLYKNYIRALKQIQIIILSMEFTLWAKSQKKTIFQKCKYTN